MTKFGIGKYRQRDGGMAEVKFINEHPLASEWKLVGIMSNGNVVSWRIDGRYFICDDNYDLISEWKEPRTLDTWVNVYEDGSTISCTTRFGADGYASDKRIACLHIVREFDEGEGL